ncbi:MAG: hypothetical protein ABI949_02150 [Ilumatobacteraceae bacterium]
MPSRKRPKAPVQPARQLSDAQRFSQSLRDSAEADRKAAQAEVQRRAQAEQARLEIAERASRLKRAQAAHQRAVELVKEANRTGKGGPAADLAWREAKADLLELETGKRPAWAARPAEPEPEPENTDTDTDTGTDTG